MNDQPYVLTAARLQREYVVRVMCLPDRRLHPRVHLLRQPGGGLQRPGDMSRRFWVIAAALVAVAGCGVIQARLRAAAEAEVEASRRRLAEIPESG